MEKILFLLILLIVIKMFWFRKEGFECDGQAPVECNNNNDCQWVRRQCRNLDYNECNCN